MFFRQLTLTILVGIFVWGTAFADASYQETQQIGGVLVDMIVAVKNSKKYSSALNLHDFHRLLDPQTKIVMVHGNRLVIATANHSTIYDLDKGTMTDADIDKKEFSVITFAQLQSVLARLLDRMNRVRPGSQAATSTVKNDFGAVKVVTTGAVKEINGISTKETTLMQSLETTTRIAAVGGGQPVKRTAETTLELWMAPTAPGYDEIVSFWHRLTIKWGDGIVTTKQLIASMFSPGATGSAGIGSAGMAPQIYAEEARVSGVPVLRIERKWIGLNKTAAGGEVPLSESTWIRSYFSADAVPAAELEIPPGFNEVPSPLLKAGSQ